MLTGIYISFLLISWLSLSSNELIDPTITKSVAKPAFEISASVVRGFCLLMSMKSSRDKLSDLTEVPAPCNNEHYVGGVQYFETKAANLASHKIE